MALERGTRLAHYEIVSELGRGGMGEVYRARDTKLGREVAIKVLPTEFAQDAERLARFDREARMLAALNHPNIAAIYGLEEHEGSQFIVLELVEGETLAERIGRGTIPVEESLKLALQIAEALEAAHGKGVIHRDLKPANIQVTPDGSIKVLDFGLAKAFAGNQPDATLSNSPTLSMEATQAGVILGTAAYMSPEQARGKEVDKRADVWALGAVLYEMLTASPAFTGDGVSEVLASVLAREPDYSLLKADLGIGVRRILRRCLQKDPKMRWQDAGDVRIEIRELLSDPHGDVTGSVQRGRSDSRSSLLWVAAVLLAAVSGIAVWGLMQDRPVPVVRFTHILPEDQVFSNVNRPAVTVSPDGSSLVFSANGELWKRRIDALEADPIPGTDEAPTGQFFSPDGEWIGYWTNSELKRIAVDGGNPVSVTEGASPLGGSYWSADGRILWGRPDGIWEVPAGGGTPTPLIDNWGEGPLNNPQLLPDGTSILFDAGPLGMEAVWVQTVEAGEPKRLFPGSAPRYVSTTGHIVYELDSVLYAVPFDPDSLVVTGSAVALEPLPFSSRYTLSESGVLVYAPGSMGGGDSRLALVDRNGSATRLPFEPAQYVSPRLSPTGEQVTVEVVGEDGRSDVWVLDLTGEGEPRNLTTGGGNHSRPIWGPGPGNITYFSNGREDAPGMFYTRADGSGGEVRLTTEDDDLFQRPGSWLPGGDVLTFATAGPGGAGTAIFTYRVGEDAPEPYFSEGRVQSFPEFSPNGRWIAYAANLTGNGFSVFVRGFPDSGRVTEIGPGGSPVWASTGRELFLAFLRSVDITTDPSVTWRNNLDVAVPNLVSVPGVRNWDIAPDGEQFVAVLQQGALEGRPRINVVLNWFEELKERVPVP